MREKTKSTMKWELPCLHVSCHSDALHILKAKLMMMGFSRMACKVKRTEELQKRSGTQKWVQVQ